MLDLALHMKIHNDKRSFECEVCGKVVMGEKRILESQTNPQAKSNIFDEEADIKLLMVTL